MSSKKSRARAEAAASLFNETADREFEAMDKRNREWGISLMLFSIFPLVIAGIFVSGAFASGEKWLYVVAGFCFAGCVHLLISGYKSWRRGMG